jgi:AcrR family transcriptional regulator
MSDIAAALDVQKPSLYHHVKSKQEILLALLDRALGMLVDHIAAISSQQLPPDQKLRQMIRGYLSALAANADLASVLLFEHRSLDKKTHTRHVPQRDTCETFELKDTALAVRALMGVMNWTLTWYQPEGGKSIEQIADDYSDFMLKGMLK